MDKLKNVRQGQILNESFYKEKYPFQTDKNPPNKSINSQPLKSSHYTSIQFIKKFYGTEQIKLQVTEAVREVLKNRYLPKNPFFGLYRQLRKNSLTFNVIRKLQEGKNVSQAKTESKVHSLQSEQESRLTKVLKIKSKQYYVPSQLAGYIDLQLVDGLWRMIQSNLRVRNVEQILKKNKLLPTYYMSMGGAYLMNILSESYEQQQIKSSERPLEINYYVQPANDLLEESMLSFSQFILDDSINDMQTHSVSAQVNVILLKLVLKSSSSPMVIQWTIQQIVRERLKICKEITKCLLSQNYMWEIYSLSYLIVNSQLCSVKLKNPIKLKKAYIPIISRITRSPSSQQSNRSQKIPSQNSQSIINRRNTRSVTNNNNLNSQNFLTQNINSSQSFQEKDNNSLIFETNKLEQGRFLHGNILSLIFEHIFTRTDYYEELQRQLNLSQMETKQINEQYRKQLTLRLGKKLREQGLVSSIKQLILMIIYDNKTSKYLSDDTRRKIMRNLFKSLDSPYGEIEKVLVMGLLHLQKPLQNDNEEYFQRLISEGYQCLYTRQLQGAELCQGSDLVYEQVRLMLGHIAKLGKKGSDSKRQLGREEAVSILTKAFGLIKGLGLNMLNTTSLIDQQTSLYFSKAISSYPNSYLLGSTVTDPKAVSQYRLLALASFYQKKRAPRMGLSLQQQTKRYKSVLQTNQIETQQLIITKYIEQNELYQILYDFHWQVIQGKKGKYPLTRLISIMKEKAIRKEIDQILLMESKRKINPVKQTTINQTQIYELSNSQYAFYSLQRQSLHQSILPQYAKLINKFSPYFSLQQQPALKATSKYILSLEPVPIPNILNQQQSPTQMTKLHADLIVKAECSINQIYALMYTIVSEFMRDIDNDGTGVIGIFNNFTPGDQLIGEQRVCSWWTQQSKQFFFIICSTHMRYDPKKGLNESKFTKYLERLVQGSAQTNKQRKLWVSVVYIENEMVQSCDVGFDIYFLSQQGGRNSSNNWCYKSALNTMENNQTRKEMSSNVKLGGRVFSTSKDLARRMELLGENHLDDQNSSQNQNQRYSVGSFSSSLLLLRDYEENHYTASGMMKDNNNRPNSSSNNNLDTKKTPSLNSKLKVTLNTIRRLSPAYSQLEHSHSHLLAYLNLILYSKTDKKETFSLKYFVNQFSLIQYYLLVNIYLNKEHTVNKWEFIFYEGICGQIAGIVQVIKEFLSGRRDNLGNEMQVLWLERMVCRLMDRIGAIKDSIVLVYRKLIPKVL